MNSGTDPTMIIESYSRFIDGLELMRIRIIESEIKVSASTPEPDKSIIENNYSFDFTSEKNGFEAICEFEFIFSDTEIDAELGRVRVKFGLTYTSAGLSVDDAAFENVFSIFQGNTLTLNVWPFAREFLMDSMHRMDWPVFSLPLIKPPHAGSQVDSSQNLDKAKTAKPKRKSSGRKSSSSNKKKEGEKE